MQSIIYIILLLFILQIPSVWGHVNVIARGTGQALVQLDVNYGVDYEPLKDQPSQPSFDLRIKEFYSNYRNKSIITIESCFRFFVNSFLYIFVEI